MRSRSAASVNSRSTRCRPASPNRVAQPGVSHQCRERLGERSGITGGHDQSGLIVLIHPGHSARYSRAHDRLAARHGFELNVAKRFGARHRGEDERRARLHQSAQPRRRHLPFEANAVREAELPRKRLPLGPSGTVAGDDRADADLRERTQQHVDALVGRRGGRQIARTDRRSDFQSARLDRDRPASTTTHSG